MSKAPDWTLVRQKAEELKNKILSKFPAVDVEYVDYKWEEWTSEKESLSHSRGFPSPRWDVHAYVLIRGDLETAEKAATLADNEVARVREESEIVIQVQKTNDVWCKNSVPLVAHSFHPGQKVQFTNTYKRKGKRGIWFLCFFDEPHDHEFGNLQSEYLASLG